MHFATTYSIFTLILQKSNALAVIILMHIENVYFKILIVHYSRLKKKLCLRIIFYPAYNYIA
jgi:hypothetical protein